MLTPAELLRAEELREGRETAIRAEKEAGEKKELEARRIEKLDRDRWEHKMAVKECDGKGSKTRPEYVIMDGRRVPRAELQTRVDAAARERKQGHDGLDVEKGKVEEKTMEEQGQKEGKESGTKSPGYVGSDGGKMQVGKLAGFSAPGVNSKQLNKQRRALGRRNRLRTSSSSKEGAGASALAASPGDV
ncbi:unnamed protein product [Scytosiphon promiscuus]